jgi:hypothetical protein
MRLDDHFAPDFIDTQQKVKEWQLLCSENQISPESSSNAGEEEMSATVSAGIVYDDDTVVGEDLANWTQTNVEYTQSEVGLDGANAEYLSDETEVSSEMNKLEENELLETIESDEPSLDNDVVIKLSKESPFADIIVSAQLQRPGETGDLLDFIANSGLFRSK